MKMPIKALMSAATVLLASACADGQRLDLAITSALDDTFVLPAEEVIRTRTGVTLENLPAPARSLDVGVYAFPDLTGQNAPSEDFAQMSRAVTQGGADILTDVLSTAGNGAWFNVIERSRVDNVLRERAIIEQTQAAYGGGAPLPPLRFAGTLIEGSIVGYDTNTYTGGSGGRLLGIGGFTQYRRDVVTVSLRAVSVSSGRVLTSVTTSKTIYSVQGKGDVFRYIAVDEILEYEAGVTRNEPDVVAIREAMELAVLSLIVEGAKVGHWGFASSEDQATLIALYDQRYTQTRMRGQRP